MKVAHSVERAGDTLGEAEYDSEEVQEEGLENEGKIDERGGRHRRKLEGV